MGIKRYVFYSETGTNTHHYFETYDEAKAYVKNNKISGGRIAYLLAYMKSEFVELSKCKEDKI